MAVFNIPEGQTALSASRSFLLSRYFLVTFGAHIVAMIAMIASNVSLQWYWLLLYSWVTIPFSPPARDPVRFFRGGLGDDSQSGASFAMLTCSTFVAWVFAKSIFNASALGAEFGIVGGIAYAAYYTSIPAAAISVYFMRTRFGYCCLSEAIDARYGNTAAVAFGLAVLYRLFQEVWSNSLVVGSFYGPTHSGNWWAAVVISTAIPAIYSITGGMRSSLITDVYQALWKIAFLVVILVVVGIHANSLDAPAFGQFNPAGSCSLFTAPTTSAQCAALSGTALNPGGSVADPAKSTFVFTAATCNYPTISQPALCTSVGGSWTNVTCSITTQPACTDDGAGSWNPRKMASLEGGLDLFVVALLQGCLSYPFFDPVLTDRAFLAAPRTMLAAFITGGALAATFILLFSFLGIYGAMQAILGPQDVPSNLFRGVLGGNPASIASFLGAGFYSIVNLVFIISSCAVVDSTFASTAKLFGPEFLGVLTQGKPRPPAAATQLQAWVGRAAIVLLAVVGTLPLLNDPTALSATTVSGTMIVGLGPPVWALTFIKGYRPLTFHLPFWAGIALGTVYQLATDKQYKQYFQVSSWAIGTGPYKLLLGFNVVGVAVCWGLAALTLLENLGGQSMDVQGSLFAHVKAAASWVSMQVLALRRRYNVCYSGEPSAELGRSSSGAAQCGAEGKSYSMVLEGQGKELQQGGGASPFQAASKADGPQGVVVDSSFEASDAGVSRCTSRPSPAGGPAHTSAFGLSGCSTALGSGGSGTLDAARPSLSPAASGAGGSVTLEIVGIKIEQ